MRLGALAIEDDNKEEIYSDDGNTRKIGRSWTLMAGCICTGLIDQPSSFEGS